MTRRKNPRHPMALQAEVKKRLALEGRLDEHGNVKPTDPLKATPPPPPPKATPGNATMLRTGMTEVRAGAGTKPLELSARERLEALPDAEIIEKATTLELTQEGDSRDALIEKLLEAGAEG